MKMDQQIMAFPKQFLWKPEMENFNKKFPKGQVVICGMGGSALAGSILKAWLKKDDIIIHRDFGLPPDPNPKAAVIVSYSGNTEETLSCFQEAGKRKITRFIIASGGKLEKLSRLQKLPFIKLPTGFQPRQAVGFMLKALTVLMAPKRLKGVEKIAKLNPTDFKKQGRQLSKKLSGKIPLFYSSARQNVLAYDLKILFNETAKMPAFANIMPELFHNEMTGFDLGGKNKKLKEKFAIILLNDPDDSSIIKNRSRVLLKLFSENGIMAEVLNVKGKNYLDKFFRTIILGTWTAYFSAIESGADPEQVPWVEKFKKMTAKA